MVAQGWLVYDLTGSAFYLGLVGFATAIPSLFLALVGGVLADRFERRRLMIITQTGAMSLAFLLAFLTLTGAVTVWHIMAIAFVAGVVNALNTPVRQTIISDLVPREALLNAVALNSAQFQASRTLGPAVAGLMVAAGGAGLVLLHQRPELSGGDRRAAGDEAAAPAARGARGTRWAGTWWRGWATLRRDPIIFSLLLAGHGAQLLRHALHPADAGLRRLGARRGSRGAGAADERAGAGGADGGAGGGFPGKEAPRTAGCCWGRSSPAGPAWPCSPSPAYLPASLAVLVLVGVSSMVYNALNQTFLQTLAEDAMRGRVMSLLTLATFGFQPLGSLAAGALASVSSPQFAVLGGRDGVRAVRRGDGGDPPGGAQAGMRGGGARGPALHFLTYAVEPARSRSRRSLRSRL